jgi:lysylphosphatidylglycerol synthetase-like protein (DUF2156 family)
MIPLTAATATRSNNMWMGAIYAGVITAVIAVLTAVLFQAAIPAGYIVALLLIGAGPVLGVNLANGNIASNWGAVIGGIISFILPGVGMLLWPVLVGALDKSQNIGRLFLASVIGIVLAFLVFFLLANVMGQNPTWIATGVVFLFAVWGGTMGAAMIAWAK